MPEPRIAMAVILTAVLAGCAGPKPFVLEGDVHSVQVGYSGDQAATMPVATQFCAQYERHAAFVQADRDVAYYDCVRW